MVISNQSKNFFFLLKNKLKKKVYVGEQAYSKKGILSLKYPIEHGIVTNWDDYEKILDQVFIEEIKVDPSNHPVLLTEIPRNPKGNREKLIQILFETYDVPNYYLSTQGIVLLFLNFLLYFFLIFYFILNCYKIKNNKIKILKNKIK